MNIWSSKRVCLMAFFMLWLGGLAVVCDVQAAGKTGKTGKKAGTREPVNSDIRLLYSGTGLASKRWIQSFAYDSKYYYYVQMTKPERGNLRITRVKYKGFNKYKKDKMDLKGFGHGTNLDCSVYGGVTYLWTGSHAKRGSDVSTGISGFRFKKNRTLYKKGEIAYQIPINENGRYATNVYPAVNANSTKLAVRFTYDDKQHYIIYKLEKGKYIDVNNPKKWVILPMTTGDFQGFDIQGTGIYTIEGGPRRSFLKGYDKTRDYQPTIIRKWNYYSGEREKKLVKGAAKLSFREPEGIKVDRRKNERIMFVSGTLNHQLCNIYKVK